MAKIGVTQFELLTPIKIKIQTKKGSSVTGLLFLIFNVLIEGMKNGRMETVFGKEFR